MKGKSTKSALLMSFTSLLLCFAMLIGSTFAWFTDSVTSGINQIKAGNLDVELYHAVGAVSDTSEKVAEDTVLFDIEHWEPGVVAYENFMVKNVGNLALKYQLGMTVGDFNVTDDESHHSLKEVLKVAVVPGGFTGTTRADAQALTGYTTLEQFSTSSNGALLPNTTGDVFGVVIYWEPTNHDNDYNLNNGKTATVVANKFTDKELGIELGIQLLAQQLPHEEDSFNKFYDLQDEDVILPDWSGESEEVALPTNSGTAKMEVKVDNKVRATAEVEAGTQINGSELTQNEKLKLTIEPDNTPNGITVDTGNSVTTYDVSLVKVVTSTETGSEGTKTDVKVTEADKPVLVSLDIGIVDLVDFYHHGTKLNKVGSKEAITDEGMYWYDQENGTVYFKTKSFSPFASVYHFAGGLGTLEHPYKIANAEQWNCLEYVDYGYYYLKKVNNDYGYPHGEYFELVDDINFDGSAPSAVTSYYSDDWIAHIDGNNHIISNAKGPILDMNWIYDIEIKNLTLKNCSALGSLICNYGCYSVVDKIVLDNVDIMDSTCKGGCAYLPWVYENYNVTIKNCDAINVTITDDNGQGFFGAFVGNSKSNVTVENCTFKGTIEAGRYEGSGLVGSSAGTIKNSAVLEGSVLIQKTTDKSVRSLGGGTRTDCSFSGKIKCEKSTQATFQECSIDCWEALTPVVSNSDITIGNDGSITYNGDLNIAKVEVYQKVNISRLLNGEYKGGYGGFDTQVEATKTFESVTTGQKLDNAFTYLTGLKNYAPEYVDRLRFAVTELPEGLAFPENYGFAILNGVGYLNGSKHDSSTDTDYLPGTYKTDTANSVKVNVFFKAYDAEGSVIAVASNSYSVALN